MNDKAKNILSRQKLSFFVLTFVLGITIFSVIHFAFQDVSPRSVYQTPLKIDLPVDTINPQGIWMNRQDETISRIDTETRLLEQKMKILEEAIITGKKKEEEQNLEKLALKEMIFSLKEDLKAVEYKNKSKINDEIAFEEEMLKPSKLLHTAPNPYFSMQKDEIDQTLRMPIREHILICDDNTFTSIEEVVPAAVSVKALLVSSVDAVCGVYANSDPVPVKLRLLDDAHLPNGVDIKLKGSLLIASAYGNISNERVYMRLERLTQVNSKGEAIETEVVGYVSGEDGKFGLQGTVIDRSVKIVKNAAVSGFLGGVGQVLQSAVSRHPVDSFNTYSVGTDIAQQGAASGASSAFDMLAEYYIKRAEQVQPVLQVNAGRIVDITFTHGFAKGDVNTKEKIRTIRCASRSRS